MCGIAGYIDWGQDAGEHAATLDSMEKKLTFRGPDAGAVWLGERAGFAHRRLIVIDPEGGAQPMTRTVGPHSFTIVYNGELYNMDEIRSALAAAGHTFLSRSDTELLLLAYAQWGQACVDRLNGIFAFAVWDHNRELLFAARDRLGVKPLYYAHKGSTFVFGSEIKALLCHPSVSRDVDAQGLAELLFIGPARTPGLAVFRDVRELRPGHCLTLSREGLHVNAYWRLVSCPHADDFAASAARVRELLEDAVTRQLVSDVPLATLLSGGLDSSVVSAIAAQALQTAGRDTLHTYSVDFRDMDRFFEANSFQTGRDAPWVTRVADYLQTVHHDIVLDTPQLVEEQLRSLAARDLPGMADIDISLYLFCKEIKRGATVALSGEAADEVFGGYPWFHRAEALAADTFPWSLRLKERMSVYAPELLAQLRPEEYVRDRYREALAEVPRLPGESAQAARIREISYLNITRFLPTLLERKDRMSMAASLEVRVPFCDHRLVEYVWNIPWEIRAQGGTPKALLREAARGWLPDDVIDRKKSPYPSTPHPAYLDGVRDRLQTILADRSSPLLELVSRDGVEDWITASYGRLEHRPWFGQIMGTPQMFDYLVQIDAWLREYDVNLKL